MKLTKPLFDIAIESISKEHEYLFEVIDKEIYERGIRKAFEQFIDDTPNLFEPPADKIDAVVEAVIRAFKRMKFEITFNGEEIEIESNSVSFDADDKQSLRTAVASVLGNTNNDKKE